MYKILLVDDEQLELETLRDYVNWSNMDIEVVGTARNGKEALEKVDELRPDIVITDVKMPIMDGLEFSKLVRQLYNNLVIIFLSGYDEFKFIKTAIDVEAAGYLLKPLDIKELNALMIKAKKKCEDKRLTNQSIKEMKKKYIKDLLFEKDDYNRRVISSKILGFQQSSISSNDNEFMLFIISINNASLLLENNQLNRKLYTQIDEIVTGSTNSGIVISVKEWQYFVIVNTTIDETVNLEMLYKNIKERIMDKFNFTSTICTSYKGTSIANLDKLCDSVIRCLDYKFYLSSADTIYYENIAGLTIAKDISIPIIDSDLLNAISSYDRDTALYLIDNFFDFLINNRISKDIIYLNTFNLLNNFFQNLSISFEILDFDISNKADIWKIIYSKDNYIQLKAFIVKVTNTSIDYLIQEHRDSNQKMVNKVLSIIDASYEQIITIESLAKEIYLSPNYLRTIFKKKTGETVLEYLTKVRIKKSTELLKDKSLKIHEISLKVGYENVSYFCSLFQKCKGLTPNEYRKKLL